MLKKVIYAVAAISLLVLQIAPPAIAAYNFPATIGQFSGDCTTASANSYVTTCTKTNGTAFGGMATQAPSAVAITGGTVDGTVVGGTTRAAVNGTTGNFTGNMTSAGQIVAYRALTTGSTTALVSTDQFVCINKTTGSATSVTQTALTVGQIFHLKDCKGDAATNNITYTPGSGITVDGASSLVMNNAYQEINLVVTSATTISVF